MNKDILIFRTDRIGDLLITLPAIFSIKKNMACSKITLVASHKNYEYAKSFKIFDNIYVFPENGLIAKIKFFIKLSKNKFYYTFVFDGKERSLISVLFVKSIYKIAMLTEKKLNFIYNFFKITYINDSNTNDLINVQQKVLDKSDISVKINQFDFIKYKEDNNFSSQINIEKFIHFHLNEKWFSNLYIKKYSDINPTYDEFIDFINNLSKKNNVLISTGLVDFDLLNLLREKFFTKLSDKIYYKKNSNTFIYLIYKPSLNDLESLFRKSKLLILCHSGIIHAANSIGIKIIDIIDENHHDWYLRWITYLKNYNFHYRNSFNILKEKLINEVNSLENL